MFKNLKKKHEHNERQIEDIKEPNRTSRSEKYNVSSEKIYWVGLREGRYYRKKKQLIWIDIIRNYVNWSTERKI